MSSKGVGLVRIERPLGTFTIAFTHLQADYTTPGQYSGVRTKQLAVVDALVRTALGPTPSAWGDEVVVLGDFNVAALDATTEYDQAFGNQAIATMFGQTLVDSWRTWMPAADPGLTQDAYNKDQHDRLDYIFLSQGPRVRPSLMVQHMRIVHRELSDHFALRADINRRADHGAPATAFVAVARAGDVVDQPPFEDTLEDGQQMRWLALLQSGTYTIVSNEQIGLEVFDASNISDPLKPYRSGRIDLSGIPGTKIVWQDRDVSPVGRTYALRGPSYVRAFARDDTTPTPIRVVVGWHRHRGTSAEERDLARAAAPSAGDRFQSG